MWLYEEIINDTLSNASSDAAGIYYCCSKIHSIYHVRSKGKMFSPSMHYRETKWFAAALLQVVQLVFSLCIGDLTLGAEFSLEKVGEIAKDQMFSVSRVYGFSEPPEVEKYEILYLKLKKCDSGGSFWKKYRRKGNKGQNCQGRNRWAMSIHPDFMIFFVH